LIEVVVSGGLEALQLPDEVVLALLEVGDLRRERGRAGRRAVVGGGFADRSGQEKFAAVAEDALGEEALQWCGEFVLADNDMRRVGVVPRLVGVVLGVRAASVVSAGPHGVPPRPSAADVATQV
jgi:hypothetical protein